MTSSIPVIVKGDKIPPLSLNKLGEISRTTIILGNFMNKNSD